MAEIDSTQGASRKAFVEWMTSTYPKAYDEYRAKEFWVNGHISSLVWQHQEARFAALVAENKALRKDAERPRFVVSEIHRDGADALISALHDEDGFPLTVDKSIAAIGQARGAE